MLNFWRHVFIYILVLFDVPNTIFVLVFKSETSLSVSLERPGHMFRLEILKTIIVLPPLIRTTDESK